MIESRTRTASITYAVVGFLPASQGSSLRPTITPSSAPNRIDVVIIIKKAALPGMISANLPKLTPRTIATRKVASKPTFQPAKTAEVIETHRAITETFTVDATRFEL